MAAAASASGAAPPPGPLLGLWGLGSLAGGVLAARLGGGARGAPGLALVLAALTAGHVALAPWRPAASSRWAPCCSWPVPALAPTFASASTRWSTAWRRRVR